MYEHVLVTLDGSELAEQVLPHVEALAEKFRSAVTLLRATTLPGIAVTPPIGLPMAAPADLYTAEQMVEALEEEKRQAAEYLRSIGERLRGRGVQVTEEPMEGNAADVMIERADALGADLLAMTTHGRSGLARLFLGSVAEEVVRRAPCPVLLVRVQPDEPAT